MDASYEKRTEVNEVSKATADNDRQPWTSDDDDALLTLWDGTEATTVDLAEMLGRTVFATQQRFYQVRAGRVRSAGAARRPARRTETVTETHTTVRRVTWDDEGYEPDWYVQ